MLYNAIYDLFRRSPTSVRKLATLVPIRYRLGGEDFADTYEFLSESETWSRDRLRDYQREQLETLLEHTVEHVPFYSDVTLQHDDPLDNLREFPVIDKPTIQKQKDAFVASDVSKRETYSVTTGGTSGNPLQFRLDNESYGKEWAFIMTGWRRTGYSLGDRLVSFRGVSFEDADDGVYWQYNPFYNTTEMSPFHLTRENLPAYVRKIRDIGPSFLHGYPSALTTLARYVVSEGCDFPDIEAVLAASEHLYKRQREVMSEAFGARVFSHYGLSEKAVLAAECERSTEYHVYPQYGVTEVVDEAGNPVERGERGEIVGTSFLTRSMPFIRYRTGDYGRLVDRDCACGRAYTHLVDLEGKSEKEKSVYRDDGMAFPIHALYHTLHDDTLENVYRVQFVQEERGELVMKIVPTPEFSAADERAIRTAIRNKVDSGLTITIDQVDLIGLTEGGKQKLLVQRVEE